MKIGMEPGELFSADNGLRVVRWGFVVLILLAFILPWFIT